MRPISSPAAYERLKLTPAEMKHKWEEEKARSQKTGDVEAGHSRKRSILSPRR